MNLEKVLAWKFPALEHTISERDCILYALGVGVGTHPERPSDLQFIYEEGLKVFPAMVNVIAHPGAWVKEPELGIDWVRILHGEQSYTLHAPLIPGQTYVGAYEVTDVVDKGLGKGAMLYLRKTLTEKASRNLVSTVTSTYVMRGDGGCGGTLNAAPVPNTIPESAADASISLTTLAQAALIYRLSGDYNPIHASPQIAKKAGFEKPILHGLCTMGVATRALIDCICDGQPERIRSMNLRFSSPVYPGETLHTELWTEDKRVTFRTSSVERKIVVLNNGWAELV